MPRTQKMNMGERYTRKGKGRPPGTKSKIRDLVEKTVETVEDEEPTYEVQHIDIPNVDMKSIEELISNKFKQFEQTLEEKRAAKALALEEKRKERQQAKEQRLLEKQQKAAEEKRQLEEWKRQQEESIREQITGKKVDKIKEAILTTVRHRRNRLK